MRSKSSKRPAAAQGPGLTKQEFASLKFRVFDQVAANLELPEHSLKICVLLCRYLHANAGGWGWMYQDALAELLAISRSRVGQIVRALIEHGHLQTKRQGQHKANLYCLALVKASEEASRYAAQQTSENPDTQPGSAQIRSHANTNPVKNPTGSTRSALRRGPSARAGPSPAGCKEASSDQDLLGCLAWCGHTSPSRLCCSGLCRCPRGWPAAGSLPGQEVAAANRRQRTQILPKLSGWLAVWQQPPVWEKPKRRSRLNGHGGRKTRADATGEAVETAIREAASAMNAKRGAAS